MNTIFVPIEQIKTFSLKPLEEKKFMKDYRMEGKYDIFTINNKKRLIKPVNGDAMLYYVIN